MGCQCAPRSSRRAHRWGGVRHSRQGSCALRSWATGAVALVRAGLGATRQSEGLLRVRGHARLRTPGLLPSGRSQTSDPLAGRRYERHFEAAEHPFADRLAVGLFDIVEQDRDEPGTGRRGLPAWDCWPGATRRGGLGWSARPNLRRCHGRHRKRGVAPVTASGSRAAQPPRRP